MKQLMYIVALLSLVGCADSKKSSPCELVRTASGAVLNCYSESVTPTYSFLGATDLAAGTYKVQGEFDPCYYGSNYPSPNNEVLMYLANGQPIRHVGYKSIAGQELIVLEPGVYKINDTCSYRINNDNTFTKLP